MSEREMRSVIQRICDELDRNARRLIFPAVVGAGLALAACGDSRPVPADGKVTDAKVTDAKVTDAKVTDGRQIDRGAMPPYGAPLYSAPDAAYGAPFDRGVDKKIDQGAMPPYGAPLYAAPDASK